MQENDGNILDSYFSYLWIWNSEVVGRYVYPTFGFCHYWSFEILKYESEKLEFGNLKIGKLEIITSLIERFQIKVFQINDSWSIAIVFRTFLDRPKMWPNLDPRSPYLSLFMAYLWLIYGLSMDLLAYLWLISIMFG